MAKNLATNTLAKGLRILEIIAEGGDVRGLTISAIVGQTGMNRSNVYRYLMTLLDLNWVERDEEAQRYRIGFKLLQTASASINQFDLRTRSTNLLQKLSEETKLTVHLATFSPPLIVYVQKIEYEPQPMMQSRQGRTASCHSTALGKAMLATMSDQQIRNLLPARLEANGPRTLTTIEELLKNLAEARRKGYAYELEENEVGVGCVAAPVYTYDGRIVAAISISGQIQLMTPEHIQFLGAKVSETAHEVSEMMGFHDPLNGRIREIV